MKICTKCKILQDINSFNKQKKHHDGLTSWCKSCIKQQEKTHDYPPQYDGTKICQKCGKEKLRNNFYKERTNLDGLENRCKICCIERKDNNHRKKI